MPDRTSFRFFFLRALGDLGGENPHFIERAQAKEIAGDAVTAKDGKSAKEFGRFVERYRLVRGFGE
jgi:hypothetical protein